MATILFGSLSAWCLFVTCGFLKLWLASWRTGIIRGRHGFRIYREKQPKLFRVTMIQGGAAIIFGFCVTWVFVQQMFLFWGE